PFPPKFRSVPTHLAARTLVHRTGASAAGGTPPGRTDQLLRRNGAAPLLPCEKREDAGNAQADDDAQPFGRPAVIVRVDAEDDLDPVLPDQRHSEEHRTGRGKDCLDPEDWREVASHVPAPLAFFLLDAAPVLPEAVLVAARTPPTVDPAGLVIHVRM